MIEIIGKYGKMIGKIVELYGNSFITTKYTNKKTKESSKDALKIEHVKNFFQDYYGVIPEFMGYLYRASTKEKLLIKYTKQMFEFEEKYEEERLVSDSI